jgi:hypothetical protein
MKVNERIPQSRLVPTSHPGLRRLLTAAAAEAPLPTILDIAERRVSPELVSFFEEQYIRLAPEKALDQLTSDEQALKSYMTQREFDGVFVLCGHAGTGKTTLLLFVTHYLFSRLPPEQQTFLPIYVGLSEAAASVADLNTFEDLTLHLRTEIAKRAMPTIHQLFREQPVQALRWTRDHSAAGLTGRFGKKDETDAQNDPETWLSQQDDRVRSALHWDLLLFYSSTQQRVVVVLDNVDRFSRDVHARILSFGDELRNYRVGCVAAMRYSTYKELDLLISEKRDPSLCLELRPELVSEIFRRRLESAKRSLTRREATPEEIDAVEWLVALLLKSESADLLSGVAGQNLHRIGKNFDRMARSNYLQADVVRGHRTRSVAVDPPLKLIYSALFGNYDGAFKADADSATAGVINVFCGMRGVVRPFALFCRLNLLARLGREGTVPAGLLLRDYCEVFSRELARAGLIITTECRKIMDEGDILRVVEDPQDSVLLSPSGKYYLRTLIFRPDYLYFMKDDCELRDDIDLGYSLVTEGWQRRMEAVCRFLTELAQLERELWERLAGETLKEGENALGAYVDRYGARGLSGKVGSASFVQAIWAENKSALESIPHQSGIARNLRASLDDLVRAERRLEIL